MSAGTVMVLSEPSGYGVVYVVTCFVNNPATEQPVCQSPWISEHRDENEAKAEAQLHREEHRQEFASAGLATCPTCGHNPTTAPSATDPATQEAAHG